MNSMGKITQLNGALGMLIEAIQKDEVARLRAEIAIITFGGTVRLAQDFALVEEMSCPTLTASGSTPMGEAIEFGLGKLDQRVAVYRANNTKRWRPWVILITDGEPTDSWENAAKMVRARFVST